MRLRSKLSFGLDYEQDIKSRYLTSFDHAFKEHLGVMVAFGKYVGF